MLTLTIVLAGYTGLWILFNAIGWIRLHGQSQVLTTKLITWTIVSLLPVLALAVLVLMEVKW